MLKLPATAPAPAIFEFRRPPFECPACANAAPIVKQALDTYNYRDPLSGRHDFLDLSSTTSTGRKTPARTARYLRRTRSTLDSLPSSTGATSSPTSVCSSPAPWRMLQQFTRKWFGQASTASRSRTSSWRRSGSFAGRTSSRRSTPIPPARPAPRPRPTPQPSSCIVRPSGWTQVKRMNAASSTPRAIDKALACYDRREAKPASQAGRRHSERSASNRFAVARPVMRACAPALSPPHQIKTMPVSSSQPLSR